MASDPTVSRTIATLAAICGTGAGSTDWVDVRADSVATMAVTSSLLVAIAGRLQDLGFKKRAGAVFTVDVADRSFGWLGLSTASRHRAARQGVAGGKTQREIAEQLMLDLIGRVGDPGILNKVNPIGPSRFPLMPYQPYVR